MRPYYMGLRLSMKKAELIKIKTLFERTSEDGKVEIRLTFCPYAYYLEGTTIGFAIPFRS